MTKIEKSVLATIVALVLVIVLLFSIASDQAVESKNSFVIPEPPTNAEVGHQVIVDNIRANQKVAVKICWHNKGWKCVDEDYIPFHYTLTMEKMK